MAKRRSFVPTSLNESSLEGRVVLSSFFGSVGNWFDSQYKNVKEDLGITHRPKTNQTVNNSLVKHNGSLGTPTPASSLVHVTHVAKTTGLVQIVHTAKGS